MQKSRVFNVKKLYFTQRIVDVLAGIYIYPLTVVEAPMGYGKTTAVRFSAESTFLSVSDNIRANLATIKNEISVALGATVSYNAISLVNRAIPEADPVTE